MYECNDKMVSHPDHYQAETGMEVIDVIESFTFDLKGIEAVDTGNALKYLCRWKKKNGLQDLKKARWYLEHLIEHVEKLEEENKLNSAFNKIPEVIGVDCSYSKEGNPLKVIYRYQCNRCGAIFETVHEGHATYICGRHMELEHRECLGGRFEDDFTQLDSKFINKEND